jgi:hypothetical protein
MRTEKWGQRKRGGVEREARTTLVRFFFFAWVSRNLSDFMASLLDLLVPFDTALSRIVIDARLRVGHEGESENSEGESEEEEAAANVLASKANSSSPRVWRSLGLS